MGTSVKRAGLFGGTFNPVHVGHLRAAEEVKNGFGLDYVYFVPAALPPHKDAVGLAHARDRQAMIERAIDSNPGFSLSNAEIRRQGRSYTIDTVRTFQQESAGDTDYYLIIGMDQFFEINTWKAFEALFEEIPFIVITRPPEAGIDPLKQFDSMAEHARRHVNGGYQPRADRLCLVHETRQPIWFFEVTPLAISSSKIRELSRNRQSIKYLVTDTVEAYIIAKDLYG
ncbi:MAG: nicotinate-nucleotide adenylyltransferase [Desulfobacterales bacterium]